MNETTDYDLVKSEIASFIGTSEQRWDNHTRVRVESAIRKGIDAVIHNAAGHQWTWMRPTFTVTTADGQRRYTLPLDFEQFIGHLYFDGENYQYPPITQLPASRLHQLYSEYSSTGVPTTYALEVAAHSGATQQHQQLVLQPTPDGSYSLLGSYQVGPIRTLNTDRPWFPGGPENRELFIASCLAAAESTFLDAENTDKQLQFKNAITGAIARDYRKLPGNLGQLGGRRMHGRDYFRWKLQTQYDGHVDSV